MSETIIVGAGWAGLACAYELVKAHHKVTIIEAAPQIGGRARGIQFQDQILDNGQHIAIGAYSNLRELLRELKFSEQQLFKILPLELIVMGNTAESFKLASLPAPWNFIIGLLFKSNMPWKSKQQICKFVFKIKQIGFKLTKDCSILECLQNYHQSAYVIESFWEPIALAVMSTDINKASAQVFLNVLKQTFDSASDASNWYLPTVDLSSVLPSKLAAYLESNGAKIIYKQNIKQLILENGICTAISSSSQTWKSDNIVLSMPPWKAKNLLQPHKELQTNYDALNHFGFEPITTLYFIYEEHVNLPYPMIGLLNATTQWIFDRAFIAQPNILSVVISGSDALDFASTEQLKERVLQEISRHFPRLATPASCKIICEKRAAFSCDINIQKYRPEPETSINNLWLTGDYLQTGLPATLEGALISGKMTASALLSISPRSNQNC